MTKNITEKFNAKFLLLEGVHQKAVDTLTEAGFKNIEYHKKSLPQDELLKQIADANIVGIRSRTQLNQEVLQAAKELLAIGCFCIGTNQVDINTASEHGVAIFNAPFSNTRSVAEMVFAEVILLMRGIPEKNALAHRGVWLKSPKNSYEVRGKKLGIIGYGNIGSQLSVLAESIGMRVYFYDSLVKLSIGNAEQIPQLEKLLNLCDVITLHVPETPETKNMIGAEQLAQMKKNGILINASRGNVVDIDALVRALENKHLSGAAVDVFPEEPHSAEDEFVSPLRDFDNIILTPHIGGSTMEAQENIGLEVAGKLIKYTTTGSTTSVVNLPEVSLPPHKGNHRIIHMHHNVPGVLSQINKIIAENDINISGQYLQTTTKIGYVVIDVDSEVNRPAVQKLREIEGSIRTRVLY